MHNPVEKLVEQIPPNRESAFGLWKDRNVCLPGDPEPLPKDGLAYQEKMRAEWEKR